MTVISVLFLVIDSWQRCCLQTCLFVAWLVCFTVIKVAHRVIFMIIKVKGKERIAVNGTPSHSY